MLKKTTLIVCSAILAITLCSCSEKVPDNQEILAAIPSDFISINEDDTSNQSLQVDNIEIYKRKTEKENDYVYATVTWINPSYRVVADCYMEFSYYDVGGWILDYITISDEAEVEVINYFPSETAQQFINQFYNAPTLVAEQFYPEKETVAYTFHIDEHYENCSYSGDLDVAYTMSHKMFFENNAYVIDIYWNRYFEDASHLTYDWNVEGNWYMEILDYFGVYQTYIDLASFDGTFVNVDAKSYYTGHGNPQDTEPTTFVGQVNLSYDYSVHSMPEMKLDFIIRKDGSAHYKVSFKKDDARVDKDKKEYNQLVRVTSEDASEKSYGTGEFNFSTSTDGELLQKYSNLIAEILRVNENVDTAEVLISDSAYIYSTEYDNSRCWDTIDLIQINGQWLFEKGLYLSAAGFEDRVIIYLCTNAGSSDIGWIYDWNGEIIRDYNGQTLPDYIMNSVYGNSSIAENSSADKLAVAVEEFLDCISNGNRDGVKNILPPRMNEIAAMEGVSEEELVQNFLTTILDDCPIWGKPIHSYHTEKLSIESAETLVEPELAEFYSAKDAGISIINAVSEQGPDCWIVTMWIAVEDSWYLMGANWFDTMDAIPVRLFQ